MYYKHLAESLKEIKCKVENKGLQTGTCAGPATGLVPEIRQQVRCMSLTGLAENGTVVYRSFNGR